MKASCLRQRARIKAGTTISFGTTRIKPHTAYHLTKVETAHAWWRHDLHDSCSLSSLLDAPNVFQRVLELFNRWMKHRRFWDSIDDTLLIDQGFPESLYAMKKKVKRGAGAYINTSQHKLIYDVRRQEVYTLSHVSTASCGC